MTPLRQNARAALFGYALTLAAVFVMSNVLAEWQRHREATAPIYAPITDARVQRSASNIVWSGVSRKLADCAVIPGSAVTLTGHWRDASGAENPRAYPASRPTGERVEGAPLVVPGGAFVVGPWIIRDTPEVIAAMVSVSSFVHCRFPSGIERFAEIGPVEISDDQK